RRGSDETSPCEATVQHCAFFICWGETVSSSCTSQSFAGKTDLRGMAVSAMTQVSLDPQSTRAGRPCHDLIFVVEELTVHPLYLFFSLFNFRFSAGLCCAFFFCSLLPLSLLPLSPI